MAPVAATWVLANPIVASSSEQSSVRQSGLSLGASNVVFSSAKALDQLGTAASQSDDARVKALAAVTAASTVKNLSDVISKSPDQATGVSLQLSLGSSRSESEHQSSSTTAVASGIQARNVSIEAIGAGQQSDIALTGTQIRADDSIKLKAAGDIVLQAAENRSSMNSNSSSGGAAVGVAVAISAQGATSPVSVFASASSANGKAQGSDLSWTNSALTAGNSVDLASGGDTTLRGAVISATTVKADVGGALNITSLQDTEFVNVVGKIFNYAAIRSSSN